MQPGLKNDLVYLLIILESAGKIELYSREYTNARDFYIANEQLNFNAALLMLSNIGEQIKKISPQLKDKYTDIEWQKIRSVRNRITHDYTGVDFEITFTIITNELPQLKHRLQVIIQNELHQGNFDKEDVNVARSSDFYRHVDFGAIM